MARRQPTSPASALTQLGVGELDSRSSEWFPVQITGATTFNDIPAYTAEEVWLDRSGKVVVKQGGRVITASCPGLPLTPWTFAVDDLALARPAAGVGGQAWELVPMSPPAAWGWPADLEATDCLQLTVVSADGRCDCVDTDQVVTLLYDPGIDQWTSSTSVSACSGSYTPYVYVNSTGRLDMLLGTTALAPNAIGPNWAQFAAGVGVCTDPRNTTAGPAGNLVVFQVAWLPTCPTTTTTTPGPTTTTTPLCSGSCHWSYTASSFTWSLTSSTCSSGCSCWTPQFCPPEDACDVRTDCGRFATTPGLPNCSGTTGGPTTPSPMCTTTTTTPGGCSAGCDWYAHPVLGWIRTANGCATFCECDAPPGNPRDCSTAHTPCVVPPPPAPPACTGTCKWVWVTGQPGVTDYWYLLNPGTCRSTFPYNDGCFCDAPSPGGDCGQVAYTNCYSHLTTAGPSPPPGCSPPPPPPFTTTTSGPGVCDGQCVYKSNGGGGWNKVGGGCLGCDCQQPVGTPGSSCETVLTSCVSFTTTTTTTPGPQYWCMEVNGVFQTNTSCGAAPGHFSRFCAQYPYSAINGTGQLYTYFCDSAPWYQATSMAGPYATAADCATVCNSLTTTTSSPTSNGCGVCAFMCNSISGCNGQDPSQWELISGNSSCGSQCTCDGVQGINFVGNYGDVRYDGCTLTTTTTTTTASPTTTTTTTTTTAAPTTTTTTTTTAGPTTTTTPSLATWYCVNCGSGPECQVGVPVGCTIISGPFTSDQCATCTPGPNTSSTTTPSGVGCSGTCWWNCNEIGGCVGGDWIQVNSTCSDGCGCTGTDPQGPGAKGDYLYIPCV